MEGEKRCQEQPGAEGESQWSDFMDAEDKGTSRKWRLSARSCCRRSQKKLRDLETG